ncbi:ATP-binding protein [Magnetospirillum sp. 64-120]|uniref:ATP-binding protein n=1 Tax=Magnetospirillum sp. 64-120 TaxID=1895778 RepID=UPI000A4A8857|nr:ATP-binding protein [Magnetospirillum sp. 64-120]
MQDALAERLGRAQARLRRHVVLALMGWSVLVGGSLVWNIQNEMRQTEQLATREARIHFNKDIAFRRWATRHGGVYVPVDERTPPSPWMAHIPDRDVVTDSGQPLTLMNPAYMLRQMMEEYAAEYSVRGRITSLNPLNPNNAADEWEASVLQRFATSDVREVSEVVDGPDGSHLRLMRAMITEIGCLKCHAGQGYQVGDIRGGIGVSVPLDGFRTLQSSALRLQAVSHGIIWMVGVVGIGIGGSRNRKRIEDEQADQRLLMELSHRNQTILNSVGEGIVGIDGTCAVIFASPSVTRILGWSETELMGKKFHDLIEPGTRVEGVPCPGVNSCCPTLMHGQGRQSVGELLRRKDAPPLPVEVQSSPVVEGGRVTGAVLVFHDISERLEGEVRRHELLERLERSNHDLQDFAYVVSHDLQEPLRMVSSYMGLVNRRYADKLDDDGRDFIAFAVDGAKRMSRMIADLVDFSRVETRGHAFAPVNMTQVVEDCLANLALSIDETGAVIAVQPDLPSAMGDREQLVRLMQNLVGNALKFRSPDRPPQIRIGGRLRDDGRREYWVADNGIGIAAEHHQRIFMIFQRVGATQVDGTGIGLSVVKRIVERHGGEITVESELGQGATFRFDLPG